MMDLRANEDEIFVYAKRYAHLIPPVSRQLMNRMSYNPVPMPETPEDRQKPKWMYSQPQKIIDVQALDKAQGALMGLAAGDAIGSTLAFVPRDKAHVDDMVGMGLSTCNPENGLITRQWHFVWLKLTLIAISVTQRCSAKSCSAGTETGRIAQTVSALT